MLRALLVIYLLSPYVHFAHSHLVCDLRVINRTQYDWRSQRVQVKTVRVKRVPVKRVR